MTGHEPPQEAVADAPPPGLSDTLQALHAGLRAAGADSLAAAHALRQLLLADLALARSALLHGLLLAALALALLGSTWLLLMAALVATLQARGLSWPAALLLAAAFSLLAAAGSGWLAWRYQAHARFSASRRQLARLAAALPRAQDEEPT